MEQKDRTDSPSVRVVDRRKFNSDGSRREDFEEAESPAAAEAPAAELPRPPEAAGAAPASKETPVEIPSETGTEAEEAAPEKGTPLLSLVLSLATSAQMSLGDVENPSMGGRYVNLEEAQGYLDILDDLQKKTRGNVSKTEERYLNAALYELKMRFVARQQEFLKRRK